MMDAEKGRSVPRRRAGAAGAWVCLLTLLASCREVRSWFQETLGKSDLVYVATAREASPVSRRTGISLLLLPLELAVLAW